MAGAAGLMAEVSRTVLEQRARAKRSGLQAGRHPPASALGGGQWGPGVSLCPRVPPEKAVGGPALRPVSPTPGNETAAAALSRVCPPRKQALAPTWPGGFLLGT